MTAAKARRRFRRSSWLTLLLYLSPLLLIITVVTCLRFQARITATQESNLELARATATSFTSYLNHLWRAEEALGNAIVETSPAPEVAHRLLAKQRASCPSVRNFLFLDTTGRVLYSSNPKSLGMSFADRDYIQALLGGKQSVVSNLLIGRISQQPTLLVGRAIKQDSTIRAIVMASVDVTKLAGELPTRTGRGDVGLVDSAGSIVFQSRLSRIPMHRRRLAPTAGAWKALRGEVDLSDRIVAETDSSVRIGVAIPIQGLGWAALASAPRAEAIAPVYQGAILDLCILALIISATLSVVFLLFKDLARHSTALSAATAAFAEGNYAVRIKVSAKTELARAEKAFNRMAARIQELEHDRTRFIQLAAHELRTPMTSIKAICGVLAKHLKSNPETDSLAGILDEEVNHLAGLVNDILNTFLLKEGRFKLDLKPVNLVDVVEFALGSFQAAEPGRISLQLNLDPATPADSVTVLGDKKRLHQVFKNFISNSVKYSPPGTPIEVTITTERPRRAMRSQKAEDTDAVNPNLTDGEPNRCTGAQFCVIVSVKDYGRGVPAGQLHKIFDPFFRATNVDNTTGQDGIGLGLNLCKDIIERHGGQVWVESEEGVGSTFYVRLRLC